MSTPMNAEATKTFLDRHHAGYLLSEKLLHFKNSDGVIVAIPHGGVPVGYQLSRFLKLPLETMGCVKINHPGIPHASIGSVSEDEVVIHEEGSIPQDYLYHQIKVAQGQLRCESSKCHGTKEMTSLQNKTVILVDDLLPSADTILACLRSVRKQHPRKIVVAVPVATTAAIRSLKKEAEEIVFLIEESDPDNLGKAYAALPKVTEEQVEDMTRRRLEGDANEE